MMMPMQIVEDTVAANRYTIVENGCVTNFFSTNNQQRIRIKWLRKIKEVLYIPLSVDKNMMEEKKK